MNDESDSLGALAELPADIAYLAEPAVKDRLTTEWDDSSRLERITSLEMQELATLAERVRNHNDYWTVRSFLDEHPIIEKRRKRLSLFPVSDDGRSRTECCYEGFSQQQSADRCHSACGWMAPLPKLWMEIHSQRPLCLRRKNAFQMRVTIERGSGRCGTKSRIGW